MKNRQLYIFNSSSRAANYGIGTYINNLVVALRNSDLEFGIIYLSDQGDEVEITEKDGYKQISIPFSNSRHANVQEYSHRNVVYLLKELIPYDKNMEYIFHLNFMGNEVLAKNLKKMFRCKIISVVHYTNWSFALNGDYSKLKKIYATNLKSLSPTDKSIVKNVRNDLKALNKADCIICVSKHTLDTYRSLGGLKDKRVEIVNNALQDGYRILTEKMKQNLREKYRISRQEKIILFAGRLDPIKGINNLLSGFKKILEKYPDTRLFIAGDGNFSDVMQGATGYWSKVSFTGRIDRKRLYELYHLADIGVVCSLYEEFGLVAIEMMMHQLPVIVTKTSGLDEIVEDNVSGLKVPVRTRRAGRMVDVKILSEKMVYLLDNHDIAMELGGNARKWFLEKYELSLFREKMLNLYSELFQKVN
ncbi:glycosyl transferase [Bacteroidia bacterium]|nr:glycosyl transferase [Bacteroidia bacterium]